MDPHCSDSTTELREVEKAGILVGWQGIPMNNRPLEECEPVIIFKSGNLSFYKWMNMF